MAIDGKATIRNAFGFHVRPSTRFFEEAQKFQSSVAVEVNGMKAEASSPMGLLSLGAVKGDEVTIHCDGPDEEEALAALIALVDDSFGGIE